jgi:hypothetical protein
VDRDTPQCNVIELPSAFRLLYCFQNFIKKWIIVIDAVVILHEALAATLALGFAGDAFARAGGGFSPGAAARARLARLRPPPRGAAPMERLITSPNDTNFRRPAPYSQGGFFSGGFGRGLLGGFIGAGLFGLLFGHGLFGGLGGGLSILGLLLQFGLLFLLFKFVMGLVRGRRRAFQGTAYNSGLDQGLGQGETRAPPGGFAGCGGEPGGAQRETSSKSPQPISASSKSNSR